jgi:uncharacterized protein YbjT (DUF2867 family)
MQVAPLHAVTGAFGFSGKYIARHLLGKGLRVITLTNSPHRQNPFGGQIKAFPYHFEQPEKLATALEGVEVLYNTYWVRFNYKDFSYAQAVANTGILFEAARKAGVKRIVHVSITNADEQSPLEYFSGKGKVERLLRESGLSHAILRPAVLFGLEGILINNIAWVLRHFPVFFVFGSGEYRLQPIFVDDLAALAVTQGEERRDTIIDAIGPETYTYRELVQEIGRAIGKGRPLVSVPPNMGYVVAKIMGRLVHDVLVTREEIEGLMADCLHVEAPPAGPTRLSDWAAAHADFLGTRYESELARRFDRLSGYLSGVGQSDKNE